jgi:hypothetical protein
LENIFPMVGKFFAFFPMIGKIFHPFSNDWKSFDAFRAWGVRKLSPPSERGVAPGGRIGDWIAPLKRRERAAGGVLRGAVDACFHLVHPQKARLLPV